MGRRAPLLASTAAVGTGFLLPGQLPTFGQGSFRTFFSNSNFTVPPGVTRLRLRCHGGGGQLTEPSTGGTASVGALISATGGLRGTGVGFGTAGGAGGQGFGGDFQASGGAGGAELGGGGGGAGSTLGVGGAGGVGPGGGGGAVGGFAGASGASGGGGASPFEVSSNGVLGGRDMRGVANTRQTNSLPPVSLNTTGAILPFPMFAFTGNGASGSSSVPAGPGGGGAGIAGFGSGIDGGGGGGGPNTVGGMSQYGVPSTVPTNVAEGLNLSRGCGGAGGTNTFTGCGGGGFAYGVFTVTPGQVLPVVAGNGALVIVEW